MSETNTTERYERKPARRDVDGCERCGRSDTSELTTTGNLLPLWVDRETGETVCERCGGSEPGNRVVDRPRKAGESECIVRDAWAAFRGTVGRLVLRVRYLSVCFDWACAEAKARRLRERLAQADAEVEFYNDWRKELKTQNARPHAEARSADSVQADVRQGG